MNESIMDLARRASFIFAGTISSPTGSSVRVLRARPGLAVVRLEHGFLINPVLGNLDGRPITVRLAQEGVGASAVHAGQRFVFFATAWVHGEQVAVNEIARLAGDDQTEKEVNQIVASLPQEHLRERIASAVLIVHGTVTVISRATDIPGTGSEHDPFWMRAMITPLEFLKGKLPPVSDSDETRKDPEVALLFPGTRDRAFLDVPRPSTGQSAVFLLHQGGAFLPPGSLVAPDPSDVQPEKELAPIRRLIESGPTKVS